MPPPPAAANVNVESWEGVGHGLAVLLGETWGEVVGEGVRLVLLDIEGEAELEADGVEEAQMVEEAVGGRGEGEPPVEIEDEPEEVVDTLGLDVPDVEPERVIGAVNEGFGGVQVAKEVAE